MLVKYTTTPPELCLWQAPASAQKPQKENQAGHSPERAVEGHSRPRRSGLASATTSTRKKRPAIKEPRHGGAGAGGGFGCEASIVASAIARACYWHSVGGFVFHSSSPRKDDAARCCCPS